MTDESFCDKRYARKAAKNAKDCCFSLRPSRLCVRNDFWFWFVQVKLWPPSLA